MSVKRGLKGVGVGCGGDCGVGSSMAVVLVVGERDGSGGGEVPGCRGEDASVIA